jgi:hypothetical protein
MRKSESLVWDLTRKLTRLLMDGDQKLVSDSEQKIEEITKMVRAQLGEEIANDVKERLDNVVTTYKKTGAWDIRLGYSGSK